MRIIYHGIALKSFKEKIKRDSINFLDVFKVVEQTEKTIEVKKEVGVRNMNAKITTVSNQKGGVCKTTTAAALAAGLKLKGYKVLAIDLDPQCDLSLALKADKNKPTIYDLMKGNAKIRDSIQTTDQGDIISGSKALVAADLEFNEIGREYYLQEIVDPIRKDYDFIIIDTPPQLGTLTVNALVACDDVIIPVNADLFSLQGLAKMSETITSVKKRANPKISINGVLITNHNARTKLNQKLKSIYAKRAVEDLDTKLFNTMIRHGVAIKESQIRQESIYNDKSSKPAQDYNSFVEEYLEDMKPKKKAAGVEQ